MNVGTNIIVAPRSSNHIHAINGMLLHLAIVVRVFQLPFKLSRFYTEMKSRRLVKSC